MVVVFGGERGDRGAGLHRHAEKGCRYVEIRAAVDVGQVVAERAVRLREECEQPVCIRLRPYLLAQSCKIRIVVRLLAGLQRVERGTIVHKEMRQSFANTFALRIGLPVPLFRLEAAEMFQEVLSGTAHRLDQVVSSECHAHSSGRDSTGRTVPAGLDLRQAAGLPQSSIYQTKSQAFLFPFSRRNAEATSLKKMNSNE